MENKKRKLVYQLDSPLTKTEWPTLPPQEHDAILDLLCRYLSPLGECRARKPVSKGKRHRRRHGTGAKSDLPSDASAIPATQEGSSSLDIAPFIKVGYANVMRGLSASRLQTGQGPTTPPTAKTDMHASDEHATPSDQKPPAPSSEIAESAAQNTSPAPTDDIPEGVFVLRSSNTSVLHTHLPQLVAHASAATGRTRSIKLVPLQDSARAKLQAALHLPSVTCLAILPGAPGSAGLMDMVHAKVAAVVVPWLTQARCAAFRSTRVNVIETYAPAVKPEKRRKGAGAMEPAREPMNAVV